MFSQHIINALWPPKSLIMYLLQLKSSGFMFYVPWPCSLQWILKQILGLLDIRRQRPERPLRHIRNLPGWKRVSWCRIPLPDQGSCQRTSGQELHILYLKTGSYLAGLGWVGTIEQSLPQLFLKVLLASPTEAGVQGGAAPLLGSWGTT